MLGPNQKKWIAALRSGEYEQSKGKLKCRTGFCCLGVWLDICGVEWKNSLNFSSYKGYEYSLPDANYKELGLKSDDGLIDPPITYNNDIHKYLTDCNDRGLTFEEIADLCEQYPESIFEEPK